MSSALLLIDFVNEIVHKDGKFASMGFPAYMEKNKVFDKLEELTKAARTSSVPVIQVRLGFSKGYSDCSDTSPLFSMAKKYGAVELGTWATEFHERMDIKEGDPVFVKHRVSAFCGTGLEAYLKDKGIDTLYIAGVATNVAVMGAVMDAHDIDYKVTVVEDCCAASDENTHGMTLQTLGMFARIAKHKDIEFQ
jgi:nicotinamidase-related amidase